MLITWKPYELHPKGLEADLAMSLLPIDVNEYIKSFWKRIEKIATTNKIPIKLPNALSKSRLALEAAEYARIQPEKYEKFQDLMYKAYFLEMKDIEKVKVILNVAAEAGLNTDELEEELNTGLYTPIVEQSKQEAFSYGISAVPAFIAGSVKKALFAGCQSSETFKQIFENVYLKNKPS